MRTNKMMRMASVLTVLCLLSSCIISGTYAKYVTAENASDTARVAKWGVALQVEGDLYGAYYVGGEDEDSHIPTATSDDDSITVAKNSSSEDNVVAPGTQNDSGFSFQLTGTPEVSSQITVEIAVQNIFLAAGTYGIMIQVEAGVVTEENFEDGSYYTLEGTTYTLAEEFSDSATYYTLEDEAEVENTYYPVIYALSGDTAYEEGSITADSLAAIAGTIADLFEDAETEEETDDDGVTTYTITSDVYAPNTDLSTALSLANETITWAWAFEQGMDGADTILGDLAAQEDEADNYTVVKASGESYTSDLTENTDYCLNTQFALTITVTQVD